MSLIVTNMSHQPIMKELKEGWKVKLSFIWDGHYFNISPTISLGGVKAWPASLKGIPCRASLQELGDAKQFLRNAKFDVKWVLNHPFVEVSPRLCGGMDPEYDSDTKNPSPSISKNEIFYLSGPLDEELPHTYSKTSATQFLNSRNEDYEEDSPPPPRRLSSHSSQGYLGEGYSSSSPNSPSLESKGRTRSNVLTRLDPRSFLLDHLSMMPDNWKKRFFSYIEKGTQSNLALSSKAWYSFVRGQSFTIIRGQQNTFLIKQSITRADAHRIFEETGIQIPIEVGQVSHSDFKLSGEGHFGEIRLGLAPQKRGAKVVLIKITRGKDASTQEVDVQKYLKDLPLIVPLLDWSFMPRTPHSMATLYQIMPPAGLGSTSFLSGLFSSVKDTQFADLLFYHIADHLLRGISSMHDRKVFHRDVKPSNLVIGNDEIIKLIDFGCSCYSLSGVVSRAGDVRYWPPEMFFSSSFDGEKVDAWMAGMTLFELIRGRLPWNFHAIKPMIENWEPLERIEKLFSYITITLALPENEKYWGLIRGLLTFNPQKRLTVREALQDSWLQKMKKSPHLNLISHQLKQYAQSKKEKEVHLTSCQDLPLPHFANYLERIELQTKVKNSLFSSVTPLTVCHGSGGSGKTLLANFITHNNEVSSSFGLIFWFRNADQPERLDNQFLLLAKELRLIEKEVSAQEAKREVEEYLNRQAGLIGKPWLVVFDNAGEPASLNPYLIKGKGHTLITTRSPKWVGAIEIEKMSSKEGEQLVNKLLNFVDPNSKRLVEVLGGLPLGIVQACAYIRNNHLSVKAYLQVLEQSNWEKVKELFPKNEKLFAQELQSLFSLWEVTLSKLGEKTPTTLSVLRRIACLAPAAIPISVLSSWEQQAVEGLIDYALLELDLAEGTFSIHRLLKEMIYFNCAAQEKEKLLPELMEALQAVYVVDPPSEKEKKRNLALHPHGQFLLEQASKASLSNEDGLINTLLWVGHLSMDEFNQVETAKDYFERALTIGGEKNLQSVRTLNLLGEVYLTLDKPQEALKPLEGALGLLEDQPVDARRAVTYNMLGRCNKSLGKEKEAEMFYKQALNEIRETGSSKSARIYYLNNLAELLRKESPHLALGYHEEAATLAKIYYSPSHYRHAILLNTRAAIYKSLGNMDEAVNCQRAALEVAEKAYNPEHPALAIYFSNLGITLQGLKKVESIGYLEKSFFITEKVYGIKSPKVYPILYLLGIACQEFGQLPQALRYLTRVFKESSDQQLKTLSAGPLKKVMSSMKANKEKG